MSEQPKEPGEAAWQVLDRVTAARKRLLCAGYKPIPTKGKRAFQAGWSRLEPSDAEIDDWARQYPDALNTGILTRTTPAVDIDVLDAEMAQELHDLLMLMMGDNGRALVRYGKRPKRAVLFQTDRPFDKIATPVFVSPDGNTHRVEVLCDGQQIVAHGTHPETAQAYLWEGGEPGNVLRDDLPYLNAELAADFVAKATELMRSRGWIADEKRKENGNGTRNTTIADFDTLYGGREQKFAAGALAEIAAEVAATVKGSRNDKLYRAAFRLGTMTVRGWLQRDAVLSELLAACRHNGYVAEHDNALITIARGLDDGEKCPHANLADQSGGEAWRGEGSKLPLQWLDMSNWDHEPVPERKWAILNRVPLNQAGLFSGEGGTGKSIIELTKDIAHVAGKDWFGSLPERGPAIYVGAEDDKDELHIRLAAMPSTTG
jgi:AAA domain-containing protein/bifunctional DNA primase/polymerase-like protein